MFYEIKNTPLYDSNLLSDEEFASLKDTASIPLSEGFTKYNNRGDKVKTAKPNKVPSGQKVKEIK